MKKYARLLSWLALLAAIAAVLPGISRAQGDLVVKADVTYTAENNRDPFTDSLPVDLPLEEDFPASEIRPPVLTIQGIFWGAEFPQAIVNDTIVKVGDTVAGAQIINIEKSGVTVRVSTREFRFPAPGLNPIGVLKHDIRQKEENHEAQR